MSTKSADDTAASITDGSSRDWRKAIPWAIALALAVVVAVSYIPTLIAPPLIDEQFLISWLANIWKTSGSSSFEGFFALKGLDPRDAWGPFTHLFLVITSTFQGPNAWAYHFTGVLLHWLSSFLVFLVTKKLTGERIPRISAAAALIFAVFPLHPEAVSWIGGRASEVATVLFLSAFYLYMRVDKGASTHRFLYALSLICFLLSLMSTWTMWVGGLILIWYELSTVVKGSGQEQIPRSVRLRRLAPFVVAAAVCLAVSLVLSTPGADASRASNIVGGIGNLAHNLLLPINKAVWHGYSREYIFLYILLPIVGAFLPIALLRDRSIRRTVFAALGWLALSLIPFATTALQDTGLYGSRWVYLATVPISIILACSCFSITSLSRRFRVATNTVAVILLLILSIFYARHLWNQNAAYKVSGRVLASIQKSMREKIAANSAPFVIARDLPWFASVVPAFSIKGAPCYDARTELLASESVPDGRLKDALASGLFQATTLRWDKDFGCLVPLDLNPKKSTFGEHVEGLMLADKLRPPLAFLQTVRYDDLQKCLIVERGSMTVGPAVSFRADELSPIDGDFLAVEAMIDAPTIPPAPRVELHWITVLHLDYDNKERKVSVPAFLNDRQFHTYYMPLRTVGWTTNGPPTQITLGFPTGSRVILKSLGVVSGRGRLPGLKVASQITPVPVDFNYHSPYCNFPTDERLGLVVVPEEERALRLAYDIDPAGGAVSGLAEISRRGCLFNNANGTELSDVTLRTYPLKALKGEFEIPTSRLTGPGAYCVRVAGQTDKGEFAGNFSDPIELLVLR